MGFCHLVFWGKNPCFFWSGRLVAKNSTFLRWISGMSGVRTPAPAYKMLMSLPTELSSRGHVLRIMDLFPKLEHVPFEEYFLV
jgi:hypothetical protein